METEHTGSRRSNWTFLTNHARVLIAIARDPGVRLRDIAAVCDLTERTVQAIVTDLQADGYLTRMRDGRRNRYEIAPGARFRHPAESGREITGLLAYLAAPLTAPPRTDGEAPYAGPEDDGAEDAGPEGPGPEDAGPEDAGHGSDNAR